jgi:preprotein translocase subunit Sec61beta
LHLVPHPSCPLSEVQFVALCHLLWRGTRNHNNTNQQSSACLLRYHSEEYASNRLAWTPYMVVERGSWAQLVSSVLLLLPILWEPTDMLNLQISGVITH